MTGRWHVDDAESGSRLDIVLAHASGVSRSASQAAIKNGRVSLNGKIGKASDLVATGDIINVAPVDEVATPIEIPDLPVTYSDDDILVIDKPAGITTHPGAGTGSATVADFARQFTTDDDAERPGIVHRLDRYTSGLLVIAKTLGAKDWLQGQFKSHAVQKTYIALVQGHPKHSEAIIDLPISRDPRRPMRQSVTGNGRHSTTRYRVLSEYGPYSLLELYPQTGRTHQLRVHLAHLGHPIVGDTTYGPKVRPHTLSRQFLHASKLSFVAPSGKAITLNSPLPPDLQMFLDRIKRV